VLVVGIFCEERVFHAREIGYPLVHVRSLKFVEDISLHTIVESVVSCLFVQGFSAGSKVV